MQQLAYPYDGKVKFELGINKQCRYSKLHLWAQTQFRSLIYLDVDTAVQKASHHLPRYGLWSYIRLIWSLTKPPLPMPGSDTDSFPASLRTSITSSRQIPTLPVSATSAMSPTRAVRLRFPPFSCPGPHFPLTPVVPSPCAQAERSDVPRHDGHVLDGAELQPRRPGLPELVLLQSDPNRRQVPASGLQRSAEAQGAQSPNTCCFKRVLITFFTGLCDRKEAYRGRLRVSLHRRDQAVSCAPLILSDVHAADPVLGTGGPSTRSITPTGG